MRERKNLRKTIGGSLLCLILILSMLSGGISAAAEGPKPLKAEMDAKNIEKYGNLVLSLTCEEMLDAGYQYGDVVSVSFLDKTMDLPFCSDYPDVDVGDPVIVARSVDTNVKIAVYLGDFATTYGLAVKSVAEDQSVSWSYAQGVQGPVTFTVSLKEAGGYYEEYLAHNLTYSDERSDYPQLTDEQFANFRAVSTTGMGKNLLYRTATPVNPLHKRNGYADAAIKNAGVTVILNLADDEATLQSFEGYAGTYYATVKHIALNMGFDYTTQEDQKKLATGLRFMIQNPGVYALHCTEGKNRTGTAAALLECLMGASLEEVKEDYMVTFYNYYGITPDDNRYDLIADGEIVKTLRMMFGTDDLTGADLAACAEAYIKEIGLTDSEIQSLKAALS